MNRGDLGVLILAGGEATRLPNKLALDAGEIPMIVRVFRNVVGNWPVYVSCKETFAPGIDALLDAPMVVDRWPLRGPLSGLISTMNEMHTRYVFAVAGDAPFVDAAFITHLASNIQAGDEAVVPKHDGGIEPLAAVYEREAFLREGLPLLRDGKNSLRGVIDKLKARYVSVDDERLFVNVNTPQEYAAALSLITSVP
jgi:molybdopterin-guanine dinucleotide biosynthesis protein A